jgi:hypothetical protein
MKSVFRAWTVAIGVGAFVLAGCGNGSGKPGEVTRADCTARFWDDPEGDGWGRCIPDEEAASMGWMNPSYGGTDQCDGTDSCAGYPDGSPVGGDSGDPDYGDSYEEDFDPYWNGQELVECPGDYWGDEPCG